MWGDQNRGAAQLRINLTNTSDNGDCGAASLYNSVTNDQRSAAGTFELRSPLLGNSMPNLHENSRPFQKCYFCLLSS